MKRVCLCLICFLCLLMIPCALAEENLVQNGGFEILDQEGNAEGWRTEAYRTQPGHTYFEITDERAHTGQYSAMVDNAAMNDARYICTLEVEPESLYRISAYVWVDRMEDSGNGANLALEGVYAASDGLYEAGNEWQYLEWYGETGENQTSVTLGVRVGGYSAESVGKAYFDDICMEKADSVPEGIIATLLKGEQRPAGNTKSTPRDMITLIPVIAAAFVLLFLLLSRRLRGAHFSRAQRIWLLLGACVLGLVLRLWLTTAVTGHPVDIGCFKSWALRVADVGPAKFYYEGYFCDYPPGMILLLWPVGMLMRLWARSEEQVLLCVKMLPVLCDLITAVLLYMEAHRRGQEKDGLLLACLVLFSPAVLVTGAAWGQMDSLLGLLILVTVILALREKWTAAFILYFLAVLIKPQALLFGPVALVWWLLALLQEKDPVKKKKRIRQSAAGIGLGLIAAVLIILPFSISQENPIGWIFELYSSTMGKYAYATVNTANAFYLFGGNWEPITDRVPLSLGLTGCLGTLLAGGLGFLWMRKKQITGLKRNLLLIFCGVCFLYQAAVLLTGGNYELLGYGVIVLSVALVILLLILKTGKDDLPLWLALILILFYVFCIKIHERYLFPALSLLLLALLLRRDRRLRILYAGFTVTTFINTAVVLNNALVYGTEYGHLNMDTLLLNDILCVANVLLALYALWIALTPPPSAERITAAEKQQASSGWRDELLLTPGDYRLHWKRRDTLIVALVTVAYGILTFTTLGSTVAPQTGWVATDAEETVTFDLGGVKDFRLLYYQGLTYNDFYVYTSEDGEQWGNPIACEAQEGLCYRWLYANQYTGTFRDPVYSTRNLENALILKGRYIRVKAGSAGLNLWEIVPRDLAGNDLPLTLVDHAGAIEKRVQPDEGLENLIDEMNTCIGEPGWYNGTYFDEIYYARTGYEHLHGQMPYETTHPPLGKLMIAASIAIFGMTPFGWRFPGALCGVLMLPAIYLLALQLFHKRRAAAVSMAAFALDLLHHAQTRLATIDSFPVLFIILSWFFMVRYVQSDPFEVEDGRERLWDRPFIRRMEILLWCGVTMGLGIASKWTGLYSAAGLAVLFFVTQWRHWRASLRVYDVQSSGEEKRIRLAGERTVRRIGLTCLLCVVLFLLIPGVIYFLCYIPHLAPGGKVTLQRVIKAQINMFNYHATMGLGSDHPFNSAWWQWPLLLKPIWYFMDTYQTPQRVTVIWGFGNPWVFYVGAVAIVSLAGVCLVRALNRKPQDSLKRQESLSGRVIVLMFLAQYLPWVFVTRGTYMYHYFASVPVIILATVWWLNALTKRKPRLAKLLCIIYVILAAAAFVAWYPYASGCAVPAGWLDAVKLFFRLWR